MKSGARRRHDGTPPAILSRRVVSNRREFLASQDPRRKTQDHFVRGSSGGEPLRIFTTCRKTFRRGSNPRARCVRPEVL